MGYLRKAVSVGQLLKVVVCVSIERETRGQVTRRDLRPDDWRDIWPELVDADPAKPAPLALGVPAGGAISSEALQPIVEAA